MTRVLSSLLIKTTSVFFFLMTFSCAGPTTPFGGTDFWTGDGYFFAESKDQKSEDVALFPNRQMLHATSPLKVEYTATSTITEDVELYVIYNQKNVTKAFQKYAKWQDRNDKKIKYIYPKLRLRPDRRHQIDIYVKSNQKILSSIKYLPPECSLQKTRSIASINPFKPERNYLNSINDLAKENQINPSFLAGLIAQESGFSSDLVSRAKAIGLTQVTPLADEELKKFRPHWKRDERINSSSVDQIAELISQKKISAKQDWRLDPVLAIEGGALYLNYLRDYWNITENKSLLKSLPNVDYSEVILASYNSGASRVKARIQKRGDDWLNDDDLKEAFKYVNSIESYCYHFSTEEK